MKWSNLKKNRCPKCDTDFSPSDFLQPGMITCDCGFKISTKRYSEIIEDMVNSKIEREYEEADSYAIKNELID